MCICREEILSQSLCDDLNKSERTGQNKLQLSPCCFYTIKRPTEVTAHTYYVCLDSQKTYPQNKFDLNLQ